MEIEEIKKQRDESCNSYLKLYSRLEEARQVVKDLIKKEKIQIQKDDFLYISLEHLGDLKLILDVLENRQ